MNSLGKAHMHSAFHCDGYHIYLFLPKEKYKDVMSFQYTTTYFCKENWPELENKQLFLKQNL